jgi:hypothetical protein
MISRYESDTALKYGERNEPIVKASLVSQQAMPRHVYQTGSDKRAHPLKTLPLSRLFEERQCRQVSFNDGVNATGFA